MDQGISLMPGSFSSLAGNPEQSTRIVILRIDGRELADSAQMMTSTRLRLNDTGAHAATADILALTTNAQIARETSNGICGPSGYEALKGME